MSAAEVDDIEYYVNFPTPTVRSEQDDVDELDTLLNGKEYAVVLVGWLNSKDQYLEKYSKFYEDKGCTTVRFCPRKNDLAQSDKIVRKLLDVLIEMNLEVYPVLFHIFSNGGCYIFDAMREELSSNSDYEDIEKLGVIYDSAPGQSTVSTTVDIFFNFQDGFFTQILKSFAYIFFAIGKGINSIAGMLGYSLYSTIYDKMMFGQDGCPELYLYSTKDQVILASDVDEVVQKRRIQGVDISTAQWSDSDHVQHFRKHPGDYIKQCFKFLTKCIIHSREEL